MTGCVVGDEEELEGGLRGRAIVGTRCGLGRRAQCAQAGPVTAFGVDTTPTALHFGQVERRRFTPDQVRRSAARQCRPRRITTAPCSRVGMVHAWSRPLCAVKRPHVTTLGAGHVCVENKWSEGSCTRQPRAHDTGTKLDLLFTGKPRSRQGMSPRGTLLTFLRLC